jgi:peptidyl-Lys metalloendopeptidase
MTVMTKRLWCLGVATALLSACAQEAQPMRIRCELSMPDTIAGAQPAQLTFSLTNEGKEAVYFLNWQTPFEGIRAPMLDVTHEGVEVEYRGPMLKRAAPAKESYLSLSPGERKSVKFDLDPGWDVAAEGRYTVAYSAQLFDVVSGSLPSPRSLDELEPMPLSCNAVTFVRQR